MKPFLLPALLTITITSVQGGEPNRTAVRDAIQRCLPWLEKGAAGSTEHNKCFTCHNHGLPIMALHEAQNREFEMSREVLAAQITHTSKHLDRGLENYRKGKGQGGRILTAGYALWALSTANHKPNETTAAVAAYLAGDQEQRDHWIQAGRRPPTDGKEFTTSYVALRGIVDFGDPDDERQQARIQKVRQWAINARPLDTEDSVFRLRILSLTKAKADVLKDSVEQLVSEQREDGGWAQKTDMESDPYATGTVLATIMDCGVAPEKTAVRNGVSWLLANQRDDGTWYVKTRAKGFQPYYESGFPHGKDQFISIAASSWAVRALIRTLPTTLEK